MTILKYIFLFLIFPGFLFSAAAGLMVGWIDRKVTARVQWRVGPPWYQNFVDVIKLLAYKETLIPQGVSKIMFLAMPLLALASATLVSTIILTINGNPGQSFIGDLIVVVYLMIIPALSIMLGGFASANSLASIGSSREMKMILSYELPFLLALIVPIIKSDYSIKLGEMLMRSYVSGPVIASASGTISFLVMLICIQAKVGLLPFDIAEAETEIVGGPCIEYSGKALGIFKLAKAIMAFSIPMFLMILYFGGIDLRSAAGFMKSALIYLAIIVAMILIKNTNPRVRIDHAIRFFWGPVTVLGIAAIVLASLGY